MINLIDILIEASLSNDANKSIKAKDYIKKIHDLINGYKSDNKQILVSSLGSLTTIKISLDDITIDISSLDRGTTKAQFIPSKGKNKSSISVLRANIHTKPKLDAEFDETALYHELIHFLDFKNIKTDPKVLHKSYQKARDKKGYAGYINNPLEVNAHFFELFMPSVVKFIEKEKQIPSTFDEFNKELLRDPKAKEFIDDLDDKNKRKVMKRLGTYYTDILKNPDFKIEKGDNIDDQQLKKATNGFMNKLKSILKIK